jgi:hypothetical protein
MTSPAEPLERLRMATGETDALAAIAVAWFDGVDWSGADSVVVERLGYLLDVIARSAANAAMRVDSVHAAWADKQPASTDSGEQWDYHKGTSPGEDEDDDEMPAEDLAIVQRIRAQCPDARFEGSSDEQLIELFTRNKRVLNRTDEDVIAAMTSPR